LIRDRKLGLKWPIFTSISAWPIFTSQVSVAYFYQSVSRPKTRLLLASEFSFFREH
jgi:hypothetical protein